MDHEGVQRVVRDLNRIYRETPGFAAGDNQPNGFEWINSSDADNSVLTFLRNGTQKTDTLAVVGNYTPVHREGFRVGVPYPGFWKEILNTDAKEYGGLGFGNDGGVVADEVEWDGRPYSIKLELPPVSMSVFRFQREA
ncbi:MAG: 1,4-alpha-glucan branching enzyme [Lentimonas sp.]